MPYLQLQKIRKPLILRHIEQQYVAAKWRTYEVQFKKIRGHIESKLSKIHNFGRCNLDF